MPAVDHRKKKDCCGSCMDRNGDTGIVEQVVWRYFISNENGGEEGEEQVMHLARDGWVGAGRC